MTDRATLLTEIFRRNAVRRAACLPLLDVRQELAHATALDAERAYDQLSEQFAAERDRIAADVQAALCREHGDKFVKTNGGRWALTCEVNRQFRNYLSAVHGLNPPAIVHAVSYGGASSAR